MRLALAPAVVLPCVTGAVKAVAVELDGQAEGGPAAVDQSPLDAAVRLGERERFGFEHAQEAPLECTEGEVHVAVQDPPEPRGAGRGMPPGEHRFDVVRRRAVEHAASWHARASASSPSTAATSTRVRATVVTGIPSTTVASRGSRRLLRQVVIPSMRRSLRVTTSGGGAGPRSEPCRCAAASPHSNAPSPHASTAASIPSLPARRPMTDAIDTPKLDQKAAGIEPPPDLARARSRRRAAPPDTTPCRAAASSARSRQLSCPAVA